TNQLQLGAATTVQIRSERLIAAGSTGSLEIADYHVDPRTGGARVATTTSIPLARVATGPDGFSVWALRHGDSVEIVAPATASTTVTEPSGSFAGVGCGHVRVVLEAEPGGGDVLSLRWFPAFDQQPAAVTPPDPDSLEAFRATARRTLAIDVRASLSRTRRDRHPVLSVVVAAHRDR